VSAKTETELQVSDGYFVHFFAPTDLKALHKHVVFVLDVSGSMDGRKIEQLKEAMTAILDDLNNGDYFNIVEFSYSVTVMMHRPGKGKLSTVIR
jgi:predicted metal-dependent peptidase